MARAWGRDNSIRFETGEKKFKMLRGTSCNLVVHLVFFLEESWKSSRKKKKMKKNNFLFFFKVERERFSFLFEFYMDFYIYIWKNIKGIIYKGIKWLRIIC